MLISRSIRALALLPTLSLAAFADGRIVVVTDEWPLSNGRGYNAPNDAAVFATNVATWFTGGGTGRFLVYSTANCIANAQLRGVMEAAGHVWVVNSAADLSLANLLTFDGVFTAGRSIDTLAFSNYINAGGNLYIAAGAGGAGGAAGEAAWYNPILEPRGLQLAGPYTTELLDVPISGSSPLLSGVDHLYAWGANQLTDLTPADPRSTIIFSHTALKIAVFDGQCSLAGDVDCDCDVELSDLAILLANFGTPGGASRQQGDFDADADVDLADLAVLLAHFGETCG